MVFLCWPILCSPLIRRQKNILFKTRLKQTKTITDRDRKLFPGTVYCYRDRLLRGDRWRSCALVSARVVTCTPYARHRRSRLTLCWDKQRNKTFRIILLLALALLSSSFVVLCIFDAKLFTELLILINFVWINITTIAFLLGSNISSVFCAFSNPWLPFMCTIFHQTI